MANEKTYDDGKPRCGWMGDDPLMLAYHDEEWGVPVHDEQQWFEILMLDGFQAGLSWRTVLHKRTCFREVFHQFDPQRVAEMSNDELAAAQQNPGIIRNRLKIAAAVKNAKAFLRVQAEYGSFDALMWSFTDGAVVNNKWTALSEMPASTPLSDQVSKRLKAEGFTFVGTTICYAILQTAGIVNDHLVSCYRHAEVAT